MSEDGVPSRSRQRICTAMMLGTIFVLCFKAHGEDTTSTPISSATGFQMGTMVETHSDKRILQRGRWYLTREFTVDFAVKGSNQTYCGRFITTLVNEVDDLMASKGKPVKLLPSDKDINVILQNGRRIKAHQFASNKCTQN